ncbi:hypothetical protein TNCV_4558221 [Trichonephila clavipes]|nr:hypothetical protein TNCV_4558221 [Trichonephila clavipes]
MRLNENYTFEGAADWCGQDLASVRCVSSLQNCPSTGFQKVSVGVGKRENNILTKYQMIKFIAFCEVWFLPESVARVATIIGDHRCHTPRHGFKETLDVFLG